MKQQTPQIILGIDPGTRATGYGVMRCSPGRYEPLDFGCIRPPVKLSSPERYLIIFNAIESLLEKHAPDVLAIESQFVYKNAQTAMKLGIARGMAILAAAKKKLPVFEYTPKKAKLAVVGHGNASKTQVQKMVQLLLRLPLPPSPEDAADALALAICHANAIF